MMAEETKRTTEEVVVCDVPEVENLVEKEVPQQPEPEKPVVKEKEEDEKVAESASFKEESNKVHPEKKALDELKLLIKEALDKHEFTAPAGEKPTAEQEKSKEEETETAPPPPPPPLEEVSIWGIPLLADEQSDVILRKFLRAKDFKVKESFSMIKSVVQWRKDFKIEKLMEEELINEGLEKVVYMRGVDKERHRICYNSFGAFKDRELYNTTFSDSGKRAQFLKYYIQFLEKNIQRLDFSRDGTCTIVQIIDLKNSPKLILFNKELRQGLHLLQDNYPEFIDKQVFINVPWWYLVYNRMISPFLTQRTKSKFVFAGPTKTAETLFKYIAPEQVPVQFGGLSKAGETEFTIDDAVTKEIIKPSCKHTIELLVTEAAGTLVWEARVIEWDVSYSAEFVSSAEGEYTRIVQKARKIGPASDEEAISYTFKIGEPGKVVLTFNNQTSKKKKLLYRSKTNANSE